MKGTGCPSLSADLAAMVKFWQQQPPPVPQVRPSHCRWCEAPSQPIGQRLNVVGHGQRQRQMWGPLEPAGEPLMGLVWVRRFLCRLCGRTMTVWPPAVVPRRYYSACAILLSLALWSLVGQSALLVRRQVSPMRHLGDSVQSWASLGRWVGAVEAGDLFTGAVPGTRGPGPGTARQAAARIVLVIAGGPLCEPPRERAHRAFWAGAASF